MAVKEATRHILCKDAGYQCEACFKGKNDDRLVIKAVEHMAQYHGASLSPELAAQVRRSIKT